MLARLTARERHLLAKAVAAKILHIEAHGTNGRSDAAEMRSVLAKLTEGSAEAESYLRAASALTAPTKPIASVTETRGAL